MKRKVEELTEKQFNLLQNGITLQKETMERLFCFEFLAKHKNLEVAKIVLNDGDTKGYFFTLEDGSNTLCGPDHEAINLEYMLQDLFICRVIS